MLARALALVIAASATFAQAQPPEALAWLRKVHDATQGLSYKGTFVYQQDGRTETSRITRYAGPGGGTEKLEVMDGVPREIVRTREGVRCYFPDSQVVKVDRRTPERDFPGLLPERVTALARYYELSLGGRHRVAGFECQEIVLKPKDDLRYGQRLYADTRTGMLLKAVTVDAAGRPIEQFTFTELTLGGVTKDMVKPRHSAASWRIEDAAAAPAQLPGWSLSRELPGFRKVVELKRRLGEARPVGQMVYSDGLAAVSVFIEPLEGRPSVRTGLASMGAIHIYTREVADHMVTVVGEAPALSVQRIADAVEYRRPQQ
ncbi:MAG TPA: MucB/RseB C-terminal domain-containing protein [Burkholderiales bacterium]|nr:MucB/RseB C-terminal domain-containing protein [Burkholderiales bacterium]